MEFSTLVRTARESKYKSARDFFKKVKIPCSYFYYRQLETGTVPTVDLAIHILKALKINLRKGLFAWARDSMPDSETKALFTELNDLEIKSTTPDKMSINSSLVINRMQAKLLKTNPIYWELALYFGCKHEMDSTLNEHDIANVFHLKIHEVNKFLNEMYEFGIIEKNGEGKFTSKEWFFIPYDPEFAALRDLNFERSYQQFLKSNSKQKFRTTITRALTIAQQRELESMTLGFINSISNIPDKQNEPDSEPVTVGIFCSTRRFGNE